MSSSYYIAGYALPKSESFSWKITEGTSPYVTRALFPTDIAQEIMKIQRNRIRNTNPYIEVVSLADSRPPIIFKNVLALYAEPSTSPYFDYVVLADNRVFWNNFHVRAAFNVRTLAGDKFVARSIDTLTLGNVPSEFGALWDYKSWSTFPEIKPPETKDSGKPFNLSQMIVKILRLIRNHPKNIHRLIFDVNSPDLRSLDKILYENIFINQPGGMALQNLLNYAPQIGIYPDKNGVIRFYQKHKGGELGIFNALPTAQDTGQYFKFVRNDILQPSGYRILFEKNLEVAFKYVESLASSGSSIERDKLEQTEERALINVGRNVDAELEVDGVKCHQGQYVLFRSLGAAWGRINPEIGITLSEIRKYFCQGKMFASWARLGEKASALGAAGADRRARWPLRISVIENDYRQLYQIVKKWRDKMINVVAHRVSIIDQATGTPAKSDVYQDYAFKWSLRGYFAATGETDYVHNSKLYKGSIENSAPCPVARVSNEDLENGIFRLNFDVDPGREYSEIWPSKIKNAPSFNPADRMKNKFKYDPPASGLDFALTDDHEMQVILTAQPAPNSSVALHAVEITLQDLKNAYPDTYNRVKDGKGPVKDLYIGANLITARVGWRDKDAKGIEANFGIGNGDPDLNKLNLVNAKHLRDVALAAALSDAAKNIDRIRGGAESLSTYLEPNGTIGSVSFNIGTDNNATTSVQAESIVTGPDFLNLLPPDTRAFIMQNVTKKK